MMHGPQNIKSNYGFIYHKFVSVCLLFWYFSKV